MDLKNGKYQNSGENVKNTASNEFGYTLIEIIITIGLISIAIGLTTFGLSTVYRSNVNSYSSQIINEIKKIQTQEMASSKNDYEVIISHNGTNYVVTTYVSFDGNPKTTFKTIELPIYVSIHKKIGADFVDLYTISDIDKSQRTFSFNSSSGKLTSDGEGIYRVILETDGSFKEFQVIKQNGKVVGDG